MSLNAKSDVQCRQAHSLLVVIWLCIMSICLITYLRICAAQSPQTQSVGKVEHNLPTTKETPDARVPSAVPGNFKPAETFTNSIGMKLTLIPAGQFMMGSPDTEQGHFINEKLHRVQISKPFYMGTYTVTQREYEKVMQRNPSYFSVNGKGKDDVAGMDTSRFPVEQVSWYDAKEFCNTLSEREGKTYRLPTEAEWEYACRAGTTTPFNFGSELNGTQANCYGSEPYGTTSSGPYLARTTKVGSYPPRPREHASLLHGGTSAMWRYSITVA